MSLCFWCELHTFLLNGTLRGHHQKYELFDPEFVAKMLRSLYIGDLVFGEMNKEETKGLFDHSSKRLAVGGFKVRKSHTNDKELKQFIDERKANEKHEQNKLVKEFDLYAMETLGTES